MLIRLFAKNKNQLTRILLLKLWPISIFVKFFYSIRLSKPVYAWINRQGRKLFENRQQSLGKIGQQAVGTLKTDGIFVTSVNDIAKNPQLFSKLLQDSNNLLLANEVQQKIAQHHNDSDSKWYLIRGLGHSLKKGFIPPSFAELFLGEEVLSIVSSYLGTQARLNYVDLWYNLPVKESEPGISSESWHRDHEDKHIVKLYVYLVDVDETMGPFMYLKRSQMGGEYGDVFPAIPATGNYPRPDMLQEVIQDRKIPVHSCVGPASSVILCDTSGFHKGGRSSTHPRVLLAGFYTSNAGLDANRYLLSDRAQYDELAPSARYALYME